MYTHAQPHHTHKYLLAHIHPHTSNTSPWTPPLQMVADTLLLGGDQVLRSGGGQAGGEEELLCLQEQGTGRVPHAQGR